MREFAFELALCARLEADREAVVSRQLGASPSGSRVIDVVVVEPGPGFEDRAAITPETIPPRAIEADVGPGRTRRPRDAFACHPERARAVVERAVEVGFLERERRGGQARVRQTARYPGDWFSRLVGIENKPDLDRPGDLEAQLRTDVSLGLLDAVVLATASHVTGAHLNRIPDAVGVWQFDPESGDREVVREPDSLAPREPGIGIVGREPGRTDIRVATPAEKARARRRIAERAYGKGWRTAAFPACRRVENGERFGAGGLPDCAWKGRLVDAATECGPACGGHEPGEPPEVDPAAERDRRSPWRADPQGTARRQSGLDHFR